MTTISRNHALLIGVGADLPNTINDAKGLAEVLIDPTRCAYDPAKVVVVTAQNATRTAILRALDKLAQQVTTDATVLLYFSGHGYLSKSALGKHYFLMPFGYDLTDLGETAISGKEFADKLAAIPAQRLLLLLDCCHAQGIGESKAPGITLTKAPLPPEAEQLFAQGSGRIILTSSKAAEVSFASTPYSLFTRALIECLCGADITAGDGYVRALDLAMYASRQVAKWSQDRQHPMADTQRADNFVVAYYAAGAKSPLLLPLPPLDPAIVTADVNRQFAALALPPGGDTINATGSQGFINRPSGPVQQHFGTRIDTGGAAYIGGNVNTSGGKFVGRDDFSVCDEGGGDGSQFPQRRPD